MIDYSKYLNSSIQSLSPSGIRKFFDIANEMEHVISLSIGEPDFKLLGIFVMRAYEVLKRAEHGIHPTGALPICLNRFPNTMKDVFRLHMLRQSRCW